MKPQPKPYRKMIAPIVIVVLMVAYYIGLGIFLAGEPELPLFVRILAIVLPLLPSGVAVWMLVERLKEIRSGEEDDLDNY